MAATFVQVLLAAWLAVGPPSSGDGALALRAHNALLQAAWRVGAAAFRVRTERFGQMTPGQLAIYLAGQMTRRPDPRQRLLDVSRRFLDTPYLHSPLGEGPGQAPDPDPLIRFDGVDCTTFVEQTLALSQARSLPEALVRLRRIRYLDGQVSYRQRKHFMEAQWLPLNQRLGLLRDVTRELGGEGVNRLEIEMGPDRWRARPRPEKWPQLDPEDIPVGRFGLDVLPLDQVLDIQDRIPAGTLVNVVRRALPGYPTRVTHQGIVVVHDRRRYLRHAGRAGYGRVVDEPLDHFVGRNRAYRKWVVDGFNLQQLLPAGRRPVAAVQNRNDLAP